jgi:hypothetical protein
MELNSLNNFQRLPPKEHSEEKKKTCIITILPSIHISSFIKIFSVLYKLSRDKVLWTDRRTDRQTDGGRVNLKSPPVNR